MAPMPRAQYPRGLRSGPIPLEQVGLWRPFAAVFAALVLPALVAWGLLLIAGTPGAIDGGDWLRRNMLFTLYALAMAPLLGWLALPLLWPIALIAAVKGWAGLLAAVGLALGVGLVVVHLALHGDLTVEDPTVLPNLIIALALQATVGWAVFWRLMRDRLGQRPMGGSSNNIIKS